MRGGLHCGVPATSPAMACASRDDAERRIGQEAPKQEEEVHDGRTLYERLQTAQVGHAPLVRGLVPARTAGRLAMPRLRALLARVGWDRVARC
jgi:hypothetical protein